MMPKFVTSKYINKNTKGRNDVTPIFENPKVFANLILDLVRPFKNTRFNKIAGLDALGFIIGGVIAYKLKVGFVPIRKGGKLPEVNGTIVKTSFIDYTKKEKILEMNKNSIKKGDKILIVDDWVETGSQLKAAIKLIEKQEGVIIGISTLFAEQKPSTRILFEKYNCKAVNLSYR